MRVALALTLILAMAAAILPAAATAAEVECEELNPRYRICEVVFIGDPGERNALHVRVSDGQVTFTDRVAVRAGRMCMQLAPHRARCAIGSEPVTVRLGRGDDLLRVTGVFQGGPQLQAVRVARVPFLVDNTEGIE